MNQEIDVQQELYDRLNYITSTENEPIIVDDFGWDGIVVNSSATNISSSTIEEIVREFSGHFLAKEGLVLY